MTEDFLTRAFAAIPEKHTGFWSTTQGAGRFARYHAALRLSPHTPDLEFFELDGDFGSLSVRTVFCQKLLVGYVLSTPPAWSVQVEASRARFLAPRASIDPASVKARQAYATQDLVILGAGDYAYLAVPRPQMGLFDPRFSHTQLDFE